MLRLVEEIPAGLLDVPAEGLHRVLEGPTLLHLPGRRRPPLFISVLLHGNEPTGLEAVQSLLRFYVGSSRALPRALSVFIGNVAAARYGLRRLEGQPDYNRVWPPVAQGDSPEHAMMRQVVREMRSRGVFASVDIHNNTGTNPHYACVNHIEPRFLHLATLFSRTVVYFVRPEGVQSMAFAGLSPAVTLECGQRGQPHGTEHAFRYLDACLHLAEHPTQPVPEHDIDLFHTVATVKVPPGVRFGFHDTEIDIRFVHDLDQLNFRELHAGTLLGWVRPGAGARLEVSDEHGCAVSAHYFAVEGGELRTRRSFMPSMLTLDERVIRQDCLCYIMERYSADRGEVESRTGAASAADKLHACAKDGA